MIRNRLKRRAMAGDKLLGAWLFSGSPAMGELYARAGYDFVLIDTEHTPIGIDTVLHCVRAVEAGGSEVLVRAPGHDGDHLKRLLDAGIHSLMIPMVDSVEQAKAVIRACRYPPRGRRGYAASVARSGLYGFDATYAETAHEETFLALQVESAAAARDAATIAGLDGADCLFIGPNDLAGSIDKLGRLTDPDVLALVDQALAGATAAGKPAGTIPFGPYDARALAAKGFSLVCGEADIGAARAAAVADIARNRGVFPGRET